MELTGDIAEKNPFAAKNRQEKLERLRKQQDEEEQARRKKEEEEWIEKQRQKEIKRQKKEAALAKARERALIEFQRQQEEEERQKEIQARAEAERKREEEETLRQKQQEEICRQREEQARLKQEEENARHRALQEKEEKKRQREERLRKQIQQAELEAERIAVLNELTRQSESILNECTAVEIISNAEAAQYREQIISREVEVLESCCKTLKRKLLEFQQKKERKEEQERELKKRHQMKQDEITETISDALPKAHITGAQQEVDPVLLAEKQERALQSRFGKDAFSKDIPLRQIAKALKDPDQCTAAALSLEKHLCKVVAEGNKNFQKYLKESAQDELQMDALLPALAETVSQYPCHLPALASLGMFAFSGVPKLFQSIQETGCIPATSKEWQAWLFGTRLYLEYCNWWCSSHKAGKLVPWQANTEKSVSVDLIKPINDYAQMQNYASERIKFLLSSIGLCGQELSVIDISNHCKAIMDKYSYMEAFFAKNLSKLSEITSLRQATVPETSPDNSSQIAEAERELNTAKKSLMVVQAELEREYENAKSLQMRVEEIQQEFKDIERKQGSTQDTQKILQDELENLQDKLNALNIQISDENVQAQENAL
eukprot:gene7134-457_t